MVNNENIIPKTETIYELKNEIPSFEEFIKTYQVDENLNYEDLGHSSLGDSKGYGPSSRTVLLNIQYSLRLSIECHNWLGDGESVEVNSVSEAERQIRRLEDGSWNSSWAISNDVLDKCAYLVRDAVVESSNRPVNGYIKVKGTFGGGEARCRY